MAFVTAYANTVLNGVFRAGYTEAPATVYVGYSKTAGTEADDENYVRQPITFSDATAGAITNSGAVTFPAADAGHNVVEAALFSAEELGTQMTAWKALTGGTVTLSAGQQFRIPASDYDVDLS